MLKTLFLGTPGLAVPFLERLHQKTQVISVVTSPDQPAGRGYAIKAPEVKTAALALGLPVFQPVTLKDPIAAHQFREFGADVGIAVAYGKLLPKEILSIPTHGFLNVHFSLLPKYRGAAPIQWALINGETETGVTVFWLDEGMDTGPIFMQRSLAIKPEDDADTLRNKLVELGVQLLDEALDRMTQGKLEKLPQTGEASKAAILKKEDGRVDWSRSAETIQNQLRGMTPWPGLHVGTLKILKVKPVSASGSQEPGTVIDVIKDEGPVVKCGQNALALLNIQPEGKKWMSAWSWWQGARLKVGDSLRG